MQLLDEQIEKWWRRLIPEPTTEVDAMMYEFLFIKAVSDYLVAVEEYEHVSAVSVEEFIRRIQPKAQAIYYLAVALKLASVSIKCDGL